MKQVLCKINKKIIFAAFIAIFCLSVGTLIQTVFVLNKNNKTYSLSAFQIYINLFIGILSAFLIVPLFTFKSKELNNYSHSFLFSVGLMTFVIILITLCFSPYVVTSMEKVNNNARIDELWLFVVFSNVSLALGILESYLIYNMIFQNRVNASIIFSVLGLLLKVACATLLISGISPFNFKIWYITLASFISTIIGVSVLLGFYVRTNKNKLPLNIKKALVFYKRGFMPGIEKVIGSGIYMLLTLNVINKGAPDWKAWNLSDTILLWGIMNITLILRYSLYYETITSDDYKYLNKVQNYYLLFDVIIFIVMTCIFAGILQLVLNTPQNIRWRSLAIKTLFAMSPFMLLEEFKKQFEIRLINKNVYYFILINIILDALLIKMPAFFLNKYHIIYLNYWTNYILWGVGIAFVVSLTSIEFNWIKKQPDIKVL